MKQKAAAFLLLGHLALLVVLAAVGDGFTGPRSSVQRGGDYLHFWAGATALLEGQGGALYTPEVFEPIQDRIVSQRRHYPSPYPPPTYQLFAPLAGRAGFFHVADAAVERRDK